MRGRVALVTGGSSGIGRAVALGLAAAGATVISVSRRGSSAPEDGIVPVSADLTDDASMATLIATVRRDFRQLDVLVHSAGTITLGRVADLTPDTLDAQYRLNVRAPFIVTRELLPLLCAARGQIVFMNSSAGLAARAGTSQYAASKHALKALADSVREETHSAGVRVLSVYAGRTATPMQERVVAMEGGVYNPADYLTAESIATTILSALALPPTAEIKDISIRPMGA